MSDGEVDLVACYSCGAAMDVAEIAPYSRVSCPRCGAQNRVKKQFGRYTLVRRHALGGMSSVFIARDDALDREVALKILSEEFSDDEKRIEAFEEEARLTASFSHPYVVRVLATGRAFGRLYIAMEFVTGGHFEQVIKDRGTVSELEMLPLAIQVAEGLKGAQAAGLIHRDIKPGNILLDTEGNAKIVDFGLALVTKGGKARATEIWATPYYVPPEAIEGGEEDFRSDIYAFGATLYHALAGKPPCDEESMATDKLRAAKKGIEPLSKAAPNLSAETCAVIDRAMAYEPEDRFGSYDEMIAGLKDALRVAKGEALAGEDHGFSREEVRSGLANGKGRNLILVGCGAVVLAVALGLFFSENEKPRAREQVVRSDLGEAVSSKRSEKIMRKYRSARNALEKGDTSKAIERFTELLEDESVQEPTRSWAGIQAVMAGMIGGRMELARKLSGKTLGHLEWSAVDSESDFSPVMRVLMRMDDFGFYQLEGPSSKEGETNEWLASYMIAGLGNWEQGGLDRAVPFFKKISESERMSESGVMRRYQNVANDYLEDFRAINSEAMMEDPVTKEECEEMIAELNRTLPLLKTRGRAAFNVKSRLADLALMRNVLRGDLEGLPVAVGEGLMEKVDALAGEFRMVEIVELVAGAQELPLGFSKESLLGLSQGALVFLEELRADLRRGPVAIGLMLRDGSEIDSLVVTQDGQLTGRELSGNARELAWVDFPAGELIKLHRELVRSSVIELDRLRRQEAAIAFDWLAGDRQRADEAAARLSEESEMFKKRWVYLTKGAILE